MHATKLFLARAAGEMPHATRVQVEMQQRNDAAPAQAEQS